MTSETPIQNRANATKIRTKNGKYRPLTLTPAGDPVSLERIIHGLSPDSETSSAGADYWARRRAVVSTPKLPDPVTTCPRKPSAVALPAVDPPKEKGDGDFSGMGTQGVVTNGTLGPNDDQPGDKNPTDEKARDRKKTDRGPTEQKKSDGKKEGCDG